MSLVKSFLILPFFLMMLWSTSNATENNTTAIVDCKNATENCTTQTNSSKFTPPPAAAMSRLLPSNIQANETKHGSASSVDIITTPESSLGLSAFSKFAETSDPNSFNPSPFLGVISEVKSFPRGVAIGEVFPDSVGHHHGRYHSYFSKGPHHIAHSYTDSPKLTPHPADINEAKPTDQTIYHKTTNGPSFKPDFEAAFRPTLQSYYKTPKSTPDYPFVFPDHGMDDNRFKDFKDANSITEYKYPLEEYPLLEKPIKEDIIDDRPFGHDDRPIGPTPRFPTHIHGMVPPGFHHHHVEGKGGYKWKGLLKFLATVIPFGILVAALSPSLLVLNSTDNADPAKSGYHRSLDGFKLPNALPGVNITECQMREICDGISSSELDSFQPYISDLIKRSGGVLKDIAELSASGRCSDIPCKKSKYSKSSKS